MRPTGRRSGRGWPKSAGEPGALVVLGAAVSDGARTPLGGDESRRAPSTGANPGGGGGSAAPSPRGRTGPGRALAGWIPGGRAGLVPGLWGPGPGSAWAGAGETGRASGLRLVRGGVEGPGGLGGEPREAPGGWARAPEGGRSLRGGGGLLPARGTTGAPLERGGGGGRVSPGVGPCRFMAARHGTYIPNPPRRSPFLGGLRGGGGGLAVVVCTHPCGGGGVAGGSSVRLGRKYPVASPGLVGPFEEEPRIRRGGLRYMVGYGMVWYGMVWYGMVWYGMVWYGMGMVWYGMVCCCCCCC